MQLLLREWPNVIALLAGLIAIKTAIITAIGPRVGLSLSESVRTGLLLSQGGEFAFVVFSLANRYTTPFHFSHHNLKIQKHFCSSKILCKHAIEMEAKFWCLAFIPLTESV